MGLRFMEHILILSDEPEATRDWWVDVLGFRDGDHPDFGFPVFWLYIGEQDVVHIGQKNHSDHQRTYLSTPSDDGQELAAESVPSQSIDHVCFNCEGLSEFLERLDRQNIDYSERQANGQSLYQLFLREPINNIKVELNFSAEDARKAGRSADYDAAGAKAA